MLPTLPPPVVLTTDERLDVVIVSYHCRDLVLACLDSLAADGWTDPARATVTVVDNGSADGTAEAVRRRHPGVVVHEQGANTGFARASNTGIARGTGRHVLLLNPDTVVTPGALDALVAFARDHPDAGVCAPSLRHPDGSDQLTARSFPTAAAGLFGRRSPLTRLLPGNPFSTRYLSGRGRSGGGPFTTDWVSGACLLAPRAVVDRVGGLDEGYFLFWEDADWCRRIGAAGYAVWCVPAAVVVHDEGGTREHGWAPELVRHFHAGAYRYWVTHHAPQPWNPSRWLARALLETRAAVLVARWELRRHRAPTPAGGTP